MDCKGTAFRNNTRVNIYILSVKNVANFQIISF